MPSNLHQVKTYLTDDERARLDELSAQTHLSRSELLRRLILGQHLPNPQAAAGWEHIRDLTAINADLARLGNLMKLALNQAPEAELPARLTTLAERIAATQDELKAAVVDLRRHLQPRRKA
ncbi:MAG: ribbon-helix-helix protein, CopG family [Rhodospirillaceae bacterium]